MRIAELESVLNPYSSLADFLARPAAVDAYFTSAQIYFGRVRLERRAFDATLRELANAPLWFQERVWQTHSAPYEFSFECERSVARGVDSEKWSAYLEKWAENLRADCGDQIGTREWIAEAKSILAGVADELLSFESRIANLKKSIREEESRAFFSELRRRPALRAVASGLLLRAYLIDDAIRAQLQAEDGEKIIAFLKWVFDHPKHFVKPDLRALIAPIVSLLRDRLPKFSELPGDIFPPTTSQGQRDKIFPSNSLRKGRYTFETSPRILHSLLSGLSLHDCSSYDFDSDRVNVARWLSLLCEETRLIFIRTETSYHGAIQMNGIELSGRRWIVPEFWSALPLARPIFKNAPSASMDFFFHFILRKIDEQKPSSVEGLAFIWSIEFDNFAVSRALAETTAVRAADVIGTTDDIAPESPQLEDLARQSSRFGDAVEYPPGIIRAAMKFPEPRPVYRLWVNLLATEPTGAAANGG